MSAFNERIKMDHELFHKIWLYNQTIKETTANIVLGNARQLQN